VSKHNIYVDGKVHVRRAMCPTCIFRPGNLMHLQEGRVEDMVENAGDFGCIPCHEHLDDTTNPVCRGFFDHGGGNIAMRLAQAMEVVAWA